MQKGTKKRTTLWVCTTAVLMALNVAMSSFGVPVPGGHLYMNDIVICTAAILLDPFAAFMVGGVGAFLGDLFFYPTPMFVSLVTHGLQAVGDFALFALCFEKAPGSLVRNRSGDRRGDYGGGLFARSGVYLQYPRIRPVKIAVPDFAGGGRRGVRYAAVLEMRYTQIV